MCCACHWDLNTTFELLTLIPSSHELADYGRSGAVGVERPTYAVRTLQTSKGNSIYNLHGSCSPLLHTKIIPLYDQNTRLSGSRELSYKVQYHSQTVGHFKHSFASIKRKTPFPHKKSWKLIFKSEKWF